MHVLCPSFEFLSYFNGKSGLFSPYFEFFLTTQLKFPLSLKGTNVLVLFFVKNNTKSPRFILLKDVMPMMHINKTTFRYVFGLFFIKLIFDVFRRMSRRKIITFRWFSCCVVPQDIHLVHIRFLTIKRL